jgi:heptaprenyl diphosphate synthase
MSSSKNNNSPKTNLDRTKRMVLTGLLFALALVLSLVENSFPQLAVPVPGVKLGLSNIAVMYALFFVGAGQAFSIAVLKALFVLITRGTVAAFLSLLGGVLSVAIMLIILFIFKEKVSYLIISVFGSVFHNIGQFIGISLIYTSMGLWAYLPILIISGIIAGIVTSTLLRFILPAFEKLGLK